MNTILKFLITMQFIISKARSLLFSLIVNLPMMRKKMNYSNSKMKTLMV